MKKGMIVMTMFAALSFLVSLSVVSTSFSGPPTRVQPKSQQQPSTVQMKEQVKAKESFWDLAVDHCVINGQFLDMSPCAAKHITVRLGKPLILSVITR